MTSEMTVAASVAVMIRRELDDDYVGLWVVPWHIRRALPATDDARVREIAAAVLEALLVDDVALGDLDEASGSFQPWPSVGAVEATMSAWRDLGRDPNIGEVAWRARTS